MRQWHSFAYSGVLSSCAKCHAMKTRLTDDPAEAAALIRRGKLVAFPTETVYGLGADAWDVKAVAALFNAKGRPRDNPLIVHIAALRQLDAVAVCISEWARALMEHFFPGSLTVVVRRRAPLPTIVTAGLDTVAVRMPSLAVTRAFLRACACPVAAPSANRSGRPSATTWQAVQNDLGGRIDAILRGEPCAKGIESTVVDCSAGMPRLLRAGATSIEALRMVVPGLRTAATAHDVAAAGDTAARSPGMRHRHYAPDARVVLVNDPSEVEPHGDHAYIGLSKPAEPADFGQCYVAGSAQDYARVLFDFFRRCESAGIRTIYCQVITEHGIGRAVMDRLRRAATRA